MSLPSVHALIMGAPANMLPRYFASSVKSLIEILSSFLNYADLRVTNLWRNSKKRWKQQHLKKSAKKRAAEKTEPEQPTSMEPLRIDDFWHVPIPKVSFGACGFPSNRR